MAEEVGSDMHVLAITEQGSHLHLEGDLLAVKRGDEVVHRARLAEGLNRMEQALARLASL